jgi:UDP:flavonoid glycosyltransferase YjiC (YdhE family)
MKSWDSHRRHSGSGAAPAIAFFVSPHGFGHATRAAAVMAAIQECRPDVRCEVFTSAPAWLFTESLSGPFGYHDLHTDVGLVQVTPLEEDPRETLAALDTFYPLRPERVEDLARQLVDLECRLVVSDIAPLGIAVGRRAGLPAVLQENFTWDWIYAAYELDVPAIGRHMAYLRGLFAAADFHIQTEPICRPGRPDLVTAPVSRTARLPREQQRRALGLAGDVPAVLVSMGGLAQDHPALSRLGDFPSVRFLVPSQVPEVVTRDNVTFLPWSGGFFHPDLIQAADAVVTKLGYSTLAEAYCAGTPCGYVTRPRFPECCPLEAFAEMHRQGVAIGPETFANGGWVACLEELLALPRMSGRPSGAGQAAAFLLEILAGEVSADS